MKVFNISPQRSGTKSFHALCVAHGLKSAHYPGAEYDDRAEAAVQSLDQNLLYSLYGDYYAGADVFSDFPTPLIFENAQFAHPAAKFVLVQRDPKAWVRSVRTITYDRDLSWLERFFYHKFVRPTFGGFGLEPYSDEELALGYRSFCTQSMLYLASCRVEFFVGQLEDPDLAPQLGSFLGFEITQAMEHLV